MQTEHIYATELDDAYIALVQIERPGSFPIRVTDFDTDVSSGGSTFVQQPFSLVLPDMNEESPPNARLRVDNANLVLISALRTIRNPLKVTVRVVLASDPETDEAGPFEFEIRDARWDGHTVECDLVLEPILQVAVPHDLFTPGYFPGLFR